MTIFPLLHQILEKVIVRCISRQITPLLSGCSVAILAHNRWDLQLKQTPGTERHTITRFAPVSITASLFRPAREFFQDVCLEKSIPTKLKSCKFSIFLLENDTRNRKAISRWNGLNETKFQCLAWNSLRCPPSLPVLPSDVRDFCSGALSHQFL